MKRTVSFILTLLSIGCLTLSLHSCSQCHKPQAQSTINPKDTTAIHLRAIDDLTTLIHKDSLNAPLYFKRAQLYQGMGDLKSALSDVYLAIVLDPRNNDYNLYAADLFIQSSEPKRAIALMAQAISYDSMNIKYYVYGGKFSYMIKDYKTALSYYNEALKHDIFNPDIYLYKGLTYRDMGDTTKALSAFQTCTEQDPKNADAFLEIGLLLQARHDKMASKYLDNAVKANPKATDALYAKGYAEQQAGRYLPSIETFKRIVEIDYRNEEALYALGVSYMQTDSIADAYKYFSMAIKTKPTYAEAYYKKGRCAESLNRKEEAKSLYRQCLNLKSDFALAVEGIKRLGGD